ncbi:MAG TPA: hypothetical protein VGC13_22280 [Longimicrobium sp.]|jgi:hypothetical protein|uniref:hypothetical protein n=1 Tax=Longimicrobium sp. TaxID=2029185 RepID=UPI002ED883DD
MNLPRREAEIPVDVAPGVRVWAEPLTDEQYALLTETQVVARDEPTPEHPEGRVREIRWSVAPGMRFFPDRLRRVEVTTAPHDAAATPAALTIAGAAFDRADGDHVAALPAPWKVHTMVRLFNYSQGLTEADVGNSARPAPPSSTDQTSTPA